MSIDGHELLAFRAISSFVVDAGEQFKNKQRSLGLYKRLIDKTTITSNDAINKHLDAFRKFVRKNRKCISKKSSTFIENRIVYSENVYINVEQLFKISDKESATALWNHILTISALLDPSSKARDILDTKKSNNDNENIVKSNSPPGVEEDFIGNIVQRVEDNINLDSTDPTEAITQMMSSGALTDIMKDMTSGMKDGQLDLGKMLGTVQGMVGKINDSGDMPDGLKEMTNSLSTMLDSIAQQSENIK